MLNFSYELFGTLKELIQIDDSQNEFPQHLSLLLEMGEYVFLDKIRNSSTAFTHFDM